MTCAVRDTTLSHCLPYRSDKLPLIEKLAHIYFKVDSRVTKVIISRFLL